MIYLTRLALERPYLDKVMTDSDWKTLDKSLIIRLPPHRAPPVLLQRLPLYRRDTTFGMAVGSESTEMKPMVTDIIHKLINL